MLYWKPVNKDDDEFNDDGWDHSTQIVNRRTIMNREEYIEILREEIAKRGMQIVELKGALKEVLATHDYHADDGAEAAERAYEVLYPDKENK